MLFGQDTAVKGRKRGRNAQENLYVVPARRSAKKGVDVIPVGSRLGEESRVAAEPENGMDRKVPEDFKGKFTAVQEQELEQLLREFLTS